jgi:hypothetical protein
LFGFENGVVTTAPEPLWRYPYWFAFGTMLGPCPPPDAQAASSAVAARAPNLTDFFIFLLSVR